MHCQALHIKVHVKINIQGTCQININYHEAEHLQVVQVDEKNLSTVILMMQLTRYAACNSTFNVSTSQMLDLKL